MNLLLDDSKRNPSLEPLSRFHSFFEWNLGGMTLLEKLERKYPGAKIYYKGPNEDFETLIFNRYPHVIPANLDSYDSIYSADSFLPWELLGTVTSIIEDTLTIEKEWKRFRQKYKAKQSGFHIVGKDKHLYIHAGATVYPGVVFDTTHGPILIEDGAKISSFSFLEGPLFVGKNSQIDNARITGGTLIGNQCRIGGEVENSIILDYTNKHHEGFLGHSFVSNWVNLGALSTTSDLKNNYGIVKLKIGDSVINTGTIKFGSIFGPFTKLAIGVMSNTGTVFDVASNIVESRIQGYVPPFTWIKPGGRYRLEEFLFDTKKIMARRGVNLFEFEDFYLRKLYGKCTE
ncbi:GlmU family protein [Leptospira paudalimensis]|uniref:GlmU family protein n=1 Tax=Leptospira paudalimensis TaxID=2950024 RepID=A0ABT3MB41_9LEPT|nr:GlmU family protein [Leptospira paudalimensis]MCW7505232.1 GlmU family protein [Leptospira paudalimensis]